MYTAPHNIKANHARPEICTQDLLSLSQHLNRLTTTTTQQELLNTELTLIRDCNE